MFTVRTWQKRHGSWQSDFDTFPTWEDVKAYVECSNEHLPYDVTAQDFEVLVNGEWIYYDEAAI